MPFPDDAADRHAAAGCAARAGDRQREARRPDRRDRRDAGHCELLRSIVRQILPLFALREVASTPICLACGPPSMISFRREVFAADRSC